MWQAYNVKQLAVAPIISDPTGGTSGPVYGKRERWFGSQSVNVNLNQEQTTLLGDGIPLDSQSSLDAVEISVEAARVTPEVEAMIYNMARNKTPDEDSLIFHEDSGAAYVGLWAMTDKVGRNGENVVLWLPRVTFASLQRNQAQRAYRTNQFSGQALFTESSYPIETVNSDNELETIYKRIIMKETNNKVSASLVEPTVGALTLVTANITGHSISANISVQLSRTLRRNTVNRYTVLFRTAVGATPVAHLATFATTTDTDDTIVINPSSNLSGATSYHVIIKSAVEDEDGNTPAADLQLTVTTA